jgi:hypothetical protein
MVKQRIDDKYHQLGRRLDQAMKDMNQVADTPDKDGSPTSYQATV